MSLELAQGKLYQMRSVHVLIRLVLHTQKVVSRTLTGTPTGTSTITVFARFLCNI